MSSVYPRRPDIEHPDRGSADITLTDEGNSEVFDALSSATARELLEVLTEEPLPPSDLADEVDASLQNIHYHLRKLERADLIEQVGTWYSSRGREMAVYAPAAKEVTINLHV